MTRDTTSDSAGATSVRLLAKSREWRVALALGMFLFFAFMVTSAGRQHYGDEAEYLSMASYFQRFGKPYAHAERFTNERGQLSTRMGFSQLPPGQWIALVPFAAVRNLVADVYPARPMLVDRLIVNCFPAAVTAGICVLVYLLARMSMQRWGFKAHDRTVPLLVALSAAFLTQLFANSSSLFADLTATLLSSFAVYALVRHRWMKTGPSWLVAAAAAVAYCCLCRYNYVLGLPALAVYGWCTRSCASREPGRKRIPTLVLVVLVVVPFACAGAVQLWYSSVRFGTPWPSGYTHERNGQWGFSTPLTVGLYGMLFSAGRSAFVYSPIAVLGVLSIARFWKHSPAEGALVAGFAAPIVISYAKWWAWYGGWEWGSRFMLFVIPLLLWASVPLWTGVVVFWRSGRGWRRWLLLAALGVLAAVSFWVQIVGRSVNPSGLWLIISRELSILEKPLYAKGQWEIRDDMLMPHYLPYFSPIAGHAWLLKVALNRCNMSDTEAAAQAPWTALNPKWAPRAVLRYAELDYWFYGDWVRGRRGPVTVAAAVLTLAFAVAAFALVRTLRSARFVEPE